MKNEYLGDIFQQMGRVSKNAEIVFGNLTVEQLNWKQNAKSWSIAQCFDHLINTNKSYEERLKAIIRDDYKLNFFERQRWFTSFFKTMLMSATNPDGAKKVKTMPVFEPAKSNLPLSIITDFVKSNKEFMTLLQATDKYNHEAFHISSPATKLIVYSLKTMCTILGNHEERHFNQAKRVLEEYMKMKR